MVLVQQDGAVAPTAAAKLKLLVKRRDGKEFGPVGNTLVLEVDPESTLYEVKCLISERLPSVPFQDQHLFFFDQVLHNAYQLSEYKIPKLATLMWEGPLKIHFTLLSGRQISMAVNPYIRIECLKTRLFVFEGVRPESDFFFQGTVLANSRLLADCGVEDGSTLHVVVRNMTAEDELGHLSASTRQDVGDSHLSRQAT